MPDIENGLPDRLKDPIAEWIAELLAAQTLIHEESGRFANMPLTHTDDRDPPPLPVGQAYDLREMAPLPENACWLAVHSYHTPGGRDVWRVEVRWSAGSATRLQYFNADGSPAFAAITIEEGGGFPL